MAQYEMAYRVQTSIPEVTDIFKESDYIFDLYGPESRVSMLPIAYWLDGWPKVVQKHRSHP